MMPQPRGSEQASPDPGALGRIWAGWRMPYVSSVTGAPEHEAAERPKRGGCVFCEILANPAEDESNWVVWRGPLVAVLCNAYPYASGHLLIMPNRHVGELEELGEEESTALWQASLQALRALRRAYRPEGLNLGANLGVAAGAGIPKHLHLHAVPRWLGDTNFMTAVAEARVLPEALGVSCAKVKAAWAD